MTLDERLSERYRERRLAWDQYFCLLVNALKGTSIFPQDIKRCAELADEMLCARIKREDTP